MAESRPRNPMDMEEDSISRSISQPIHTVASIRAIEGIFLPHADPPLMERAGAASAAAARQIVGASSGSVAIVAGPGNNGGDAFVAARLLQEAGYKLITVFADDPDRLPPDAHAAYLAYRAAGGTTVASLPSESTDLALAIDGLFGIGLARPLAGRFAEWVDWFNRLGCPVLAIDIPSGLDADTGRVLGCAVQASHTATFIALKPGLLTLDGPDHCGIITVHELGLPQDHGVASAGATVAPNLFAAHLSPRHRNSHKGSWGDAGIIGGAPGMVGAALLAGRAALKLGAGRIFVGLLAKDTLHVDPQQLELMLRTPQHILDLSTALALGPGLGQSDEAHELLGKAITLALPLVLDADALNLLAAHPVLARRLSRRDAPTLITPHPAEAARLLGTNTAQVQDDRIAAARELTQRFHCHALLKGCGSVIAAPDGRWFINTTGNPGMASAGMGDTLTGIAVALLAQHWPAESALLAAVHLHGAAGDALANQGNGPIGLAAGELIEAARRLLNRWTTASGDRSP